MSDRPSTVPGPGKAHFPAASMDAITRGITVVVLLVLAGIVTSVLIMGGETVASAVGAVLVVAVTAGAYALSPSGFLVEPGTLVVERRLAGSREFEVDPATAERVDERWFPKWSVLRLAGSGGLFGWFGVFWKRDIGRFNAYVTDHRRVLVLHRRDEPDVAISPADPDTFLTALKDSE